MKITVIMAAAAVVAAPTHATELATKGELPAACQLGARCAVEGILRIIPGTPYAASRVESGTTCFIVALPDDILMNWRSWNNVPVRFEGEAMPRGAEDEGIASLQYKDRWIATMGGCSGSQLVLYVTSWTKVGA